jgi:hypothetical protein
MFYSRVRGGPCLDSPPKSEIKLHNATLSYLLPSGFQGLPENNHKIINYRTKQKRLKQDISGYEFFYVDSACWEYFHSSILNRWFKEPVGELTFQVKVHKYPNTINASTSQSCMAEYVQYFLHTYLEGEKGRNARIRKNYPYESEGELANILVDIPKKIDKVIVGNAEWLNFRVYDPPARIDYIDYYFTPLNDEFALSFEWAPTANHSRKRDRKEVGILNQKAIDLMKTSIELEFH